MRTTPRVCVVLRTCARVHSLTPRPRIMSIEKPELILRSLRSFCRSSRTVVGVQDRLELHVVDDASGPELVDLWQMEARNSDLPVQWHRIDSRAGAPSFDAAIDIALCSNCELVYFLEDDYLHYQESVPCLLESHSELRRAVPDGEIALTPYDCPDRYLRPPYPTTLRYAAERYWRTVRHTTGTFLVSKPTLEKHLPLYRRFATYGRDGTVSEDSTINHVYRDVPCYSPIPTLAIHLQYEETIPLVLPPGGWISLWTSLAR